MSDEFDQGVCARCGAPELHIASFQCISYLRLTNESFQAQTKEAIEELRAAVGKQAKGQGEPEARPKTYWDGRRDGYEDALRFIYHAARQEQKKAEREREQGQGYDDN